MIDIYVAENGYFYNIHDVINNNTKNGECKDEWKCHTCEKRNEEEKFFRINFRTMNRTLNFTHVCQTCILSGKFDDIVGHDNMQKIINNLPEFTQFKYYVETNDFVNVDIMLQNNPNLESKQDKYGRDGLWHSKDGYVVELLIIRGFSAFKEDKNGNCFFFECVDKNKIDLVRIILKSNKVCINYSYTKMEMPAIYRAIENKNQDMVDLLVEYKANVKFPLYKEKSAIEYAKDYGIVISVKN